MCILTSSRILWRFSATLEPLCKLRHSLSNMAGVGEPSPPRGLQSTLLGHGTERREGSPNRLVATSAPSPPPIVGWPSRLEKYYSYITICRIEWDAKNRAINFHPARMWEYRAIQSRRDSQLFKVAGKSCDFHEEAPREVPAGKTRD